jgi:formate dehydrogenase major subunit
MKMNRRRFLQYSGAAGSQVLIGSLLNLDQNSNLAYAQTSEIKEGKITTTICPYCGVGCGALVTSVGDKIVHVEGDPEHPINEGSLCSKGSAMFQIANNELRLTKVKYRAPGASAWEEKDWEWAIARIADNIKSTRDKTFVSTDTQGRVVNRAEGMACLGGAALDNEECYAYSKWARSLGVVYIEHQARL